MARKLSRALSVAAVVLASGCSDATSILVEVTSDFTVPDQVDALRIVVTGDAAGSMVDETYALESDWPHTVSIRPGDVESQGILVEVSALSDGALVAQRMVRSEFVSGEQVVVRVVLDASCEGVTCPTGETCEDGRCVPVVVPDGGMFDGGTMDGGPRDGGMTDAGCASAAECDDSVACTTDNCTDGECINTADDSLCAEGTTCDPVDGCPPRVCEADSQCADGVVCNGSEVCADMSCAAGAPVDCNDGDACTSDICSEAMRGACVHTTRDLDEDGYGDLTCPEVGGVPATDCNDENPEVFPGAPEVCNGLDDDCNLECDESFTCCRGETGACTTTCGTTGVRVCGIACSWSVCSPPAEMCNGVDDDCNGAADDVYACVQGASESCTTACGTTGTRSCQSDCSWSACVAPAETCNGIDDDCSGTPDDTFACVAGSMASCTTSCGSTGSQTCDGTCTLGSCVPPAEGCTGVDDDCDGAIDETVECSVGEMRSCTTSCGSTGSQTCSSGCTYGACAPPTETCNGVDDDCDGSIDETFTCVPGAVGTCSASCGTTGTRTCTSSCTWGSCTPPIEACNGSDDDCDSMCDETFACCAGTSGSCTTSCGSTGSRTCSGSCGWSACSPPAETCNGTDDDCNGVCDDGFTCCAGRTGTCTTSCGSTGSRTCSASCGWGSCSAPAETCNGADDDCDTTIDEGFACVLGSTGSCTTSCGSTGTRACASDCSWQTCDAPTESCNGVDDDCDSMVDEGCGACGGCTGATTVSTPGGRYDVTLGAHAQTGSCGGAGSEGYLTFTTTATRDVFITTHQAGSVDTVLYVRDCSCTGAERACNDNANGLTTSTLRLTNLPAGTYNVVVDTKTAMSGTVPVDVYITTPGTESDRCGNPTFLAPATSLLTAATCGFAADYDPPSSTGCSFSGSGGGEDRVYYFYLPSSRTVTFDGCTSTSDYDQTIFYRSVCTDDAAPSIACNDDGCGGSASGCAGTYRSSVTATLGPGLYYFFADGYGTGTCSCGNYEFQITGL